MNLKNFFLLVIFTFSSALSFGQINGKAYYKKLSTHNFGNLQNIDNNSKAKSAFKSVNNSISDMQFELTFNDTLASYIKVKTLDSDSQNSLDGLAASFSGYNGPYYFNLKTRKSLRKQGKYLIEREFKDYDWQLTKEMITIDSLTCFKATTTLKLQGRSGEILRPVTAWYTTDINLQIGPDGFSGLPGLIIQLESNKVVTTLEKIEFIDKSIEINIPTKGKKMTAEAFAALMKDLVENREKYYDKN